MSWIYFVIVVDNSGDSINLAQKLVADGHTWITYTNYCGVKRYAMID